jgi:hippurate hydrolase
MHPATKALLVAAASSSQSLAASLSGLDAVYPQLDALYLDLHQNPELSGRETKTAAKVADRLRKLGYEVTTGVGGTGVVGVLRNGPGPTVLLRTELDALPVEEKTGLPYASKVTAKDSAGKTVPVMHACGHDVHMASWTGAAAMLARSKDRWRGTVLMIAQPAEETVSGAKAMIADGLFSRFPKPDFAIAVHDKSDLPAGKVTFIPGYALANVDSVDVTLFGRGGHGAKPDTTVDPILMAARTVLALQGLVSREKDPLEPGVVTVGSIQGGFKHNIIPDQVHLQITVRSYTPEVRKLLLDGIVRIAKAEAAVSQAPREPEVRFSEPANATYNDPALTQRLGAMLARELGQDNVSEGKPEMVAEDFGELGKAASAPSVMFRVGAAEPTRYAEATRKGEQVPSLHSSTFAPDRERTIKTSVAVLTLSALELLGKPGAATR